jgi:acid stress-induced BolA-like protein IbaG/YrbA
MNKNDIQEVAEPLSKGEKNFKAMHKVLLNKKLVPGVTDQDHVFNGIERKKDQPTASYEIYKSEDESKENYDKGLKVKDDYYATEETVDEARFKKGEDVGGPGMNFKKIAAAAAKKYGSKIAGERVAGAVLKKVIAKEEVETVDEKTLTPAELKKREEVAKAIGRENPDMPMAKKMAIATATAKKVTEDVDYDYEGEMAKAELRAMSHKADQLASMMSDDQQLEAWLQSKISRAKDQIDAVYDYMMFRETPAADVPAPSQSVPMADTYGSFLNRMGEEVEQVEEAEGSKKDLAALAPPRDKVTQKDILVGRGVLKKHPNDPNKHVLAKEETDSLEIKSPALSKALDAFNSLRPSVEVAHTEIENVEESVEDQIVFTDEEKAKFEEIMKD